jgi:hypothetical protein
MNVNANKEEAMNERKALAYMMMTWGVLVIGILFYTVYNIGVTDGRLQGLECATDTECEVLHDMLDRN